MNEFTIPLVITSVSGIQLSLRLLTETDIPVLMELERSAHSHPWRQSSFEDCLKGRQRCWLAEHNGNLVGYVVITHGGGGCRAIKYLRAPQVSA